MKVGDLVKFKGTDETEHGVGKGILVEIRTTVGGAHGVLWDFLGGFVGWQREYELEVIA